MFLAGAAAALSMPDSGIGPYNFNFSPWSFPVFAFSLGALFLNIRGSNTGFQAASAAYVWALGYFTLGLSWVGNALLIDGNPYAWAYPLALIGLPALLSLFHAFVFGLTHRFLKCSNEWQSALLFVALFTLAECARGTLFTGFPWLLPGMYWSNTAEIFHGLALVGIYGLTLLTLFWALSLVLLCRLTKGSMGMGAASILSAGLIYADATILAAPANEIETPLQVVLVQANIPQAEKWDGSRMADHFYTHIALSRRPVDLKDQPTVIIWPETAIPPSLVNAPVAIDQIRNLLATYPKNSVLLAGALLYDDSGPTPGYTNSAVIYDQTGAIISRYDKAHLVPFGEYIPFQKYVPLGPVAQFEGLKPGPSPAQLEAPGILPFVPFICYEVIFPGTTKSLKPRWLVNLTNDSWYGDTAGPRQHLALARARAVETGLPMVRVAGTGISAIIDTNGRVIQSLPFDKAGAIHGNIYYKSNE
jgi:apolipoprotein N-acyltransferase